jgi:hypothetical protein
LKLERPPQGNFWELARERMKQEVKPGVVIVVPPDRSKAAELAYHLGQMIGATEAGMEMEKHNGTLRFKGWGGPEPHGPGDPAAQMLFCQAVFVCLTAEETKQAFPDFKAEAALILLDLEGKPLDCLKPDGHLFGKDFAERMARFLYGDKGQHLQPVVEAQRKALGPAVCDQLDAAIRDLDSSKFTVRQAASRRLEELAPRATGPLAAALEKKPPLEVRRRIEQLFREIYAAAPQLQPSPRLPFGVQWEVQHVDPCPGCGQGFLPHGSRLFLNFIANRPKDQK